jgi:uncharacterized membrane protein (TIGR02234 family)
MTPATGRALSYTALVAGAVLALVASGQPWWRVEVADAAVPLSGNASSAGLTQALALVTATGLLLSLALAARGRQVLGAVLVLAGAGMAWVGVARPEPSARTVQEAVRSVSLSTEAPLQATAWPWAYATAGLLVALGGALLVALAPRWAARRSRFERGPVTVDLDDPTAIWKALDAGVDPTDETAVTSLQQDATQDRKRQR